MSNSLTRFKPGSIKELITIALPLGFASMSFHLMLFFDRILLSRYSMDAMNAAGSVSIMIFAFSFFGISVASIAEVFAGQNYGAKKYQQLARPVWQMIWFSLMLIIPFYLIGILLDDFIVHGNLGDEAKEYFRFSMNMAFISILNAALISFYVARGKTKFITINTVFGSILNMALAYWLIFGVKGYLEPQGLMGAAYATTIAMVVQCATLFGGMLSASNRRLFNTGDYRLDWPLFKQCIKVGLPNGVGHFVEICGWAVINYYLCGLGHHFITIYTLTQNFIIVCAFYTDALQKAIVAIASNAIGADKILTINKTLNSAIKLQFIMTAVLALPLIIFATETLKIFISDPAHYYIIPLATMSLIGCWIYFLVDGITYTVASILLAGGDTTFLMITNSVFSWAFAVLPTLLFIKEDSHPSAIWVSIMPLYAFALLGAYYWRYKGGKWEHKVI